MIILIADLILFNELLLYMFKHIRLGFNIGTILRRKQLNKILELMLSEGKEYCIQERRLNIYAYRWQFVPFYLVRIGLANLVKNHELKELNKKILDRTTYEIASYSENNNIIEIYEFNLLRWCNKINVSPENYMIEIIFHEYRHKYQFNLNLKLNTENAEKDSEEFANIFFKKNKNAIEQIIAEGK